MRVFYAYRLMWGVAAWVGLLLSVLALALSGVSLLGRAGKSRSAMGRRGALTPDGGHGICGYAAFGSVAGVWVLS